MSLLPNKTGREGERRQDPLVEVLKMCHTDPKTRMRETIEPSDRIMLQLPYESVITLSDCERTLVPCFFVFFSNQRA